MNLTSNWKFTFDPGGASERVDGALDSNMTIRRVR